ncbi:GH32 C-terminal domain-containing protein [Dysgonomonas sp. Shenzhen-Wh21]|uniref:GH32 C-terminal domain-containing protein n=1 Tax=Dysgonomonas TaxID=156973 RepID=UPI00208DFAC2|nr:GH32 C-terminal domain-containing protein [Dysgonomonas mossii]
MKKKIGLLFCTSLIIMTGCSSGDIVIDDFESGTYDKWTIEGTAFGTTPVQGRYPNQQEVNGFDGKFLANSYNGGDQLKGSLSSSEFKIEREYINFLLGGGKSNDIYIELLVDGKSIYKNSPLVNSETLQWTTWDVRQYKGLKAKILITDNHDGGWGHILVDQIIMSNMEKSSVMIDHKISFKADKKYILVPIDDSAPEISTQLIVNGQAEGVPMNINIAQSEVSYWVPIDIERYKGDNIDLVFSYIDKNSIGYSQIKQSDDFHFNVNEKYRPTYHFTPKYGWMNDPNGMVYHNGKYHLYYQHNPYGSLWGNLSWGHAESKDLIKWEHQQEGITPDSLGAIFSGSAVIDKNNTAGFGKNAMVAIYTSAAERQTQSIAYSLDNGQTFTKYNGNPVLTDSNIVDFRDPKVFWHEVSQKWVMSLATSQTITFYGSKNLKEWEKLSEFGEGLGGHDGVWECPDLFPLTYNGKTKWVLFVSINPGGPNGGSATQYFIGDFDGKTFKADKLSYPIWLDYGRDNYAGVTWNDAPDNRRIFIGWMNNWDYAREVPIINFKSACTLPRELKLTHNGEHLVISNPPVKEIVNLRNESKKVQDIQVESVYTIDKLLYKNDGAYEVEMTLEAGSAEKFSFTLENRRKEQLKYSFNLKDGELLTDRSKSGVADFSEKFASKVIKAPLAKKNTYKIRLFIDNASSELFVNDGELVSTNIIFPSEPYNSLKFEGNINVKDITIHKIK